MARRKRKNENRPESPAAAEDVRLLLYPLAALNAVLNRTPVDLKRLGSQLTLYPALAREVLERCQTALPEVPVSSIDEAVLHLGIERVRILLTMACLADFCRQRLSPSAGRKFLQAADSTGRVSESLARMTGYGWPERAYLAGMLHDAGKLLLLPACAPDDQEILLNSVQGDEMAFERQRFGTDHIALGEWLGLQWRLAENVIEVMTHHHFPQNARMDPQLVNIVALARWIAREEVRRGDEGSVSLPEVWTGGGRASEVELD